MFEQSVLPKSLELRTIKSMDVGISGYTVPWAMFADRERLLWLDGSFEVQGSARGTADMLIKRAERGFIVYLSTIHEQRYMPREISVYDAFRVTLSSDPP